MPSNPYAPPSATTAETANNAVAPNREVLTACKLLWVSMGLSLVSSASQLLRQLSGAPVIGRPLGTVIGIAVGFAITWWFVSKLKAGRNWMRLFLTITTVLGYVCVPIFWKFYSASVFPMYAANPIAAGVALLQIVPNTWAVVLLNVPRSRAWFAAAKTRLA